MCWVKNVTWVTQWMPFGVPLLIFMVKEEKHACHENVMVKREFGPLMDDSEECQHISHKMTRKASWSVQ